jgi:hypothetical protein
MAMRLRRDAPYWEGAKCAGFRISPENDPWFHQEEQAVRICNGDDDGQICPRRTECLLFALANNENAGVWGGMFTHDRTPMRRYTPRCTWGWHPPTDPEDAPCGLRSGLPGLLAS